MLRNYLLTAWKVFMRRKLFTAINLACIVLTLVVLTVIAALLETMFYPSGVEGRSGRFLQATTVHLASPDGRTDNRSPLGYKLIDKYLKPMPGVERVAAVTGPSNVSVYQGDRVTQLMMRRADADYWKILDFDLLAGRLPTLEDDAAGRPVVVVNRATAARLFPGAPAAAVGQRIDIGGQAYGVIGVVDNVIHLNAWSDIWAPVTSMPNGDYRNDLTGPFSALILARDPADLPRIRRDVERIARGVVADDPAQWKTVHFWADSKLDLAARTLFSRDDEPDSGAGTLLALFGAAALLFMLLPALNLVNLNTGRILERQAEIGVRKAFGATSGQLALQLIVESVLLSLAGGVLAFGASVGVIHWLESAGPLPYLAVNLNPAVFGWGMLMATVFGFVSGVLPAWKMSRLDPVHALKGTA